MESMSVVSSCSEEASQDLKSAELEQEVQATHDMLYACTYRTCPIWMWQQDSKLSVMMRLKPSGDQVMSQP